MTSYITRTHEEARRLLDEIRAFNPELTNEEDLFLAALRIENTWANEKDARRAHTAFKNSGHTRLPECLELYRDFVTGIASR